VKTLLLLCVIAPVGCAHSMLDFAGAPRAAESQAPGLVTHGAPARVRSNFPEALAWHPELITDEKGEATFAFRAGDSITTWDISATAHSRAGQLGFGGGSFRTFQSFFLEPDLPAVLTQGDRITLPVALFNYTDRDQRVRVALDEDPWYDLAGDRERIVVAKPKQATPVTFDITARRLGTHALTVRGRGETEEIVDAVRRAVTVWPDGRERTNVVNLRVEGPTTLSLDLPADAIAGTGRLVCKCYPGVYASLLDGLEGMLRKPHG
jgi:uncharacterized protein YfaS (alpha-2-macroglobulin family)